MGGFLYNFGVRVPVLTYSKGKNGKFDYLNSTKFCKVKKNIYICIHNIYTWQS